MTSRSQTNNDFPFSNPATLTQFTTVGSSGASWLDLFPITSTDFPDIEGDYAYTVTDNNLDSEMHDGNHLNRAAVVPHPTNLAVSDFSTTPEFSFTDPDPEPAFGALDRFYQAVI